MKKILIVDDREEIRELVNVTLRGEDYQIFEAKTGQEAVEIATGEKPDLIIMDVMMPGEINGLEATRLIKNNLETKKCKIVILSAKGQKIDIEKGTKSGADDYFVKPFEPLDLIAKVEEVIR
jgi:CheY-like chemotaxis protein